MRDTRQAIYDLLGREVIVLLDQSMEPEEYEYDLDAQKLVSGVYFCQFESGIF